MAKFLLSRVLQALVTLWVVTVVIFLIPRLTGNAADALLPPEASNRQREILIQKLGMDKPVVVQYGVFIRNLVTADFGQSFRNNAAIKPLLAERLVNSVKLGTVCIIVAILMAVPLGTLAALNRGKLLDRLLMMVPVLGQSMPSFWAGVLLILILSVWLGWLPAQSRDPGDWTNYIMPAVSLGWSISSGVTRLIRSSMLEVRGLNM